jgi:hypothetical protein
MSEWSHRLGRLECKGKLGKNYQDSSSTKKVGIMMHTFHLSYTGDIRRRLMVQVSLVKNVRYYLKKLMK